jgi:hypothetical protein
MKAAVVHGSAAQVERDWANQFAGLDADVKKQFPAPAVDWATRVNRVFTIPKLTPDNKANWDNIVNTVTSAAQSAGPGGEVIVVSGHGGSAFDPQGDGGIIIWDPTATTVVDWDWTAQKIHSGLFWDDDVVSYIEPIPHGNPPTRKEADEKKSPARTRILRFCKSVALRSMRSTKSARRSGTTALRG